MTATPRDITETAVAKALAHPLRSRILAALHRRTASPSELALELDAPLGVASYHVRRLSALGLVKLVRRVPRRGAVEHYYTAVPLPPVDPDAWPTLPSSVRRSVLGGELRQLGTAVTAAAAAGGFDPAAARLTRALLTLDEQGWQEAAEELDRVVQRLAAIQSDSKRRAAHPGRHVSAVIMLFEPAQEEPEHEDASSLGKPEHESASSLGKPEHESAGSVG